MKDSIKKMNELIKKSRGLFLKTILLVLLPVLIINCYIFYSGYESTVNDYTKIDAFDFDNITVKNYMVDFPEALMSVRQAGNTDLNATDIVFYIANYAISVFIDGFLIILAIHLVFDKEYKTKQIVMLALQRCFAVVFFGIIASWALSCAGSAMNSNILKIICFARGAAHGSKLAPMMLGAAAVTAVIHAGIIYFLLAGVMMLVFYSTVAAVSGRCRWFASFRYVLELLDGKKFRQLLHFLVPTLLAFFIPIVLQAAAMYTGLYTGLVLAGISVIMQTVFNAMLWFYTVSNFIEFEKERKEKMKAQTVDNV